jgi:hypothetical protein
MAYWIEERDAVRVRKTVLGLPAPWTDDETLATYRFCNVQREHDRVTIWIARHWRTPHARDPDLWHAMMVARMLNWPDTLAAIGYPEPWGTRRAAVGAALRAYKAAGHKVFTGAYIVSTNGAKSGKVPYVLAAFDAAYAAREHVAPRAGDTLATAHAKLMQVNGLGSFLAAQLVADLKQTPVLRNAPDWHDWAAPGPGSLRGLGRVRGLRGDPKDPAWKAVYNKWRRGEGFIDELRALRLQLQHAGSATAGALCLQDLQNCLCEFDKYERVLHGQGRPRSTYQPTEGEP